MAWGSAWTDTGRVFTREDGTPLRPGWISVRFGTLAARAGLPPYGSMTYGTAPPRCCSPRANRPR
jgi:hypothetical protein